MCLINMKILKKILFYDFVNIFVKTLHKKNPKPKVLL